MIKPHPRRQHTKFLLDDLEDLLLVELLWDTLDSRQSFATISLCSQSVMLR